jgi:hypothetical protein
MGWSDKAFVLYYSHATKRSRKQAGQSLEMLAGQKDCLSFAHLHRAVDKLSASVHRKLCTLEFPYGIEKKSDTVVFTCCCKMLRSRTAWEWDRR